MWVLEFRLDSWNRINFEGEKGCGLGNEGIDKSLCGRVSQECLLLVR